MNLIEKAEGSEINRMIISDNDIRDFGFDVLNRFLQGYNILDYYSQKKHFSIYIRTFEELVRGLNHVTLDYSLPFRYRLRKIKKPKNHSH